LTCKNCGNILIFWDEFVCPKCKGYSKLDSITASEIAKKRTSNLKELWNRYVITLDKNSVIAHITWQREKLCREFFREYNTLDIAHLLSDTLLLKRVMETKGQKENAEMIDDEEKATKLRDLHSKGIIMEEDNILVESCLANILYLKKFSLEEIHGNHLFDDFIVLHNERFYNLIESYENYNLLSEQKGKEKIEQWRPEFERLMKEKPQIIEYTREEFVKKQYDTICTFYLGLLRNRVFLEAFDLREYSKLVDDPAEVIRFVNTFEARENAISACNTAEFLIRAKKFFKREIPELKKILLLEVDNPDAFPLFVRVKNSEIDYVLISHRFTALIHIFLHAVITKDLFDKETEIRGKKFEKEVSDEFEKKGFTCIRNVKDSELNTTLEIDVLAIKNKNCFVVETKAHRLPTLIEESNRTAQVVRDIKGIVDGIKYSTIQNKIRKEKIPSLLDKINYIKNNRSKFDLNDNVSIEGVIVSPDYTWIEKYKGVKIVTKNKKMLEFLR